MIKVNCDICGKKIENDTVFARLRFEPKLPQNMRCKTDFELCVGCATRLSKSIESKTVFPEQCQGVCKSQ